MNKQIPKLLSLFVLGLAFTACDSLIDLEPDNQTRAEEVLRTEADAQELLNSCYDVLANTFDGQSQVLSELPSDNLARPATSPFFTEVYLRNTNFFNSTINDFLKQPYITIFRINSLFASFDEIEGLTASKQTQIEAEARFLRAINYFDLVNKFAQPYGYTSDNSHPGIGMRQTITAEPLPRSSVQEVYDQLLADLLFAEANLPETNGNYATSWAAKALLAKVYFQMHDYTSALAKASEVIDNGPFMLGDLNRHVFSVSSETIFGVITATAENRNEAMRDNYRSTTDPELTIHRDLYLLATSDEEDQRAQFYTILNEGNANEVYALNKFDESDFHIPILTLTDMLLLRAEGLAELNQDLATAVDDVNRIIARAYTTDARQIPVSSSAMDILAAARLQRRLEFPGEGDWVLHLKRRGAQGEAIKIRGAEWDCPGMVLQFPISEKGEGFEFNEEGGCDNE